MNTHRRHCIHFFNIIPEYRRRLRMHSVKTPPPPTAIPYIEFGHQEPMSYSSHPSNGGIDWNTCDFQKFVGHT